MPFSAWTHPVPSHHPRVLWASADVTTGTSAQLPSNRVVVVDGGTVVVVVGAVVVVLDVVVLGPWVEVTLVLVVDESDTEVLQAAAIRANAPIKAIRDMSLQTSR
jgi:hypothetical protein